MFCRDKEATAVATALHGYDYYPRPPRGSRAFPYSKDLPIDFWLFLHNGEVSARIVLPFFFKPTDIHSIGFLRFRLFFRMIY